MLHAYLHRIPAAASLSSAHSSSPTLINWAIVLSMMALLSAIRHSRVCRLFHTTPLCAALLMPSGVEQQRRMRTGVKNGRFEGCYVYLLKGRQVVCQYAT
jgi:hypothetical protein